MCSGEIPVLLHQEVGVGDLELLGQPGELTAREGRDTGPNRERGTWVVADVAHHPEHDETVEAA